MDIPSIPHELLCHSCLLRTYGSAEGFADRSVTPASEALVTNVRIELHRKRDTKGYIVSGYSGTLYYDCAESRPEELDFFGHDSESSYRSTVIFMGKELTVTKVKYVYGASQLHHLEVSLEGTV